MKVRKFLLWLNLISGAALALTPFVLFPVCAESKPDGTLMKCWYSGVFITTMGILIVLLSMMLLRRKFTVCFSVLSAGAALMCWLVPNGIIPLSGNGWECGLCGDPAHACRAVTAPALGVMVAAVILACVVTMTLGFVCPDPGRIRGH